MHEEECTAALAGVLELPRIRLLLAHIYYGNRRDLDQGVTCRPCRGTTREGSVGYYDPNHQRIVICCERVRSPEDLEETLAHELVHAYDAGRQLPRSAHPAATAAKTLCRQIACSEIRASLFGQCHGIPSSERRRECVFQSAVRSTRRHCPDAEQAVAAMFEACIARQDPFDASSSTSR
ncbi:peptidase M76 [Thamnocephalis sphaerospora]|uniref:Mitochondrial inner membrane protease ATP23 n=1 Tax=Thamnocephalis sphaerospora TaxID=78915 RepID=A0A4P9XZL3_9FUNG|nr:peptidase M76 [Thamnocephalis sphaerospora]|eukprot:RKP10920.1 peptidase M76 [Thamnocephalis sphaerospora]